jgi:hypothetical protein
VPLSLDVAAGLAAFLQILLVVFFGAPEGLGRFNLGDDALGSVPGGSSQLLDFGFRFLLLFGGVKEDGGAVLSAPVGPLTIESGGVVEVEEGVEELVVADFLVIEVELHNFGVTGLISADVFIGGPVEASAFVTNRGSADARDSREGSFNAPETACSECGFFNAHINLDARAAFEVTRRQLSAKVSALRGI